MAITATLPAVTARLVGGRYSGVAIVAALPAVAARLAEQHYSGIAVCLPPIKVGLWADSNKGRVYRIQREPQVNYVAASPAVPATRGGWAWARKGPIFGTIILSKYGFENGILKLVSGRLVAEDDVFVTYASQGKNGISWLERAYQQPRPEIPAVDPQTIVTGRRGWDGGGRGQEEIKPGETFWFLINRATAVQGGLARPGIYYTFGSAKYAWYRHGNQLECLQSGTPVAPLGSVSDATLANWRFGIQRTSGGEIRWVLRTSANSPPSVLHSTFDDGGALVPIGLPYAEGDSIDALGATGEELRLTADLPAVKARMGQDGYSHGSSVRMPWITAKLISYPTGRIAAAMPMVRGRLGMWANLHVSIPTWRGAMRSEPVFSFSDLFAPLEPIRGGLSGIVGATAMLDATLPAVVVRIEQEPHARIQARLPAATGHLSDFNSDFVLDAMTLGDEHALEAPLVLITIEGVGVGDTASISVILNLAAAEGVRLTDLTSVGDLVHMAVEEGIQVSDGGGFARREALQYAVNILTGSPSVYQGFDFSGFVSVDDIAYGWRADGLYRIGANHDETDTIRALVDFGISDYGGAQRKRVAAAWLGVRTDGQTYLKVRADDGAEQVYRAVASGDNYKAILGKGLAGRQWSVTLELEDATFASLDSLELEIAVMARRFGGD